jgi:hypothetical protein
MSAALEPAASLANPQAGPGPPSASELYREPQLVRFGLRQLFVSFSAAVVLIALVTRMGGVWPIIAASVSLLVAAHVLGTFVGTRLRDTSAEVTRWKARPGSLDPDYPVATVPPVSLADLALAAPPLASYERIGRWRNWFIAAGTMAGAGIGAVAINGAAGEDLTWPGLGLGAVSCAVIGTWISLLGVNFYAIARHTLQQANCDLAQDQAGR